MQNIISRKTRYLDTPTVMGSVKERLIEKRFNIDRFERMNGLIEGRRNNLHMILLGLYRKVKVKVKVDRESENVVVRLAWSGYYSSYMITFVEVFLLSLLFLKTYGTGGVLGSVLLGVLFSDINLVLYMVLKYLLTREIKRDIWDLEKSLRDQEESQSSESSH